VTFSREKQKAKKDLLAAQVRDKRVQEKEKLKLTPKQESKPISKNNG
jgi:hypothetical protein